MATKEKTLKLYHLPASPNCMKVRMVLGYKKIPCEKILAPMENTQPVIALSGQPLKPVLEHGGQVIYDSYSIVRYLDANFPDTPRVFSSDREAMHKIEEWENYVRTEASLPVTTVFREAFSKEPNAKKISEANQQMQRVADHVEKTLSNREYLLGVTPTAADFTLAPMVYYGMLSPKLENEGPLYSFFVRNLHFRGCAKTRDWVEQMMAWDR